MTREARLLMLTIAVSAVVLLLLAQLRFPEAPPAVAATAPLERLAARASFEDLATRVAQIETGIAPNLIVLRLAPDTEPAPSRLSDIITQPESAPAGVRHVPALRFDATTAVAAIPPQTLIAGIVGEQTSGTAEIVAADPIRGLARVRVPERAVRAIPQLALDRLRTPTYVVAVEGTRAGLTVRPVFLGRSDRFQSPRWTRPLLPLGGVLVTPGALIFSLDGEFLGAVVSDRGTPAVAGAAEVMQAAALLDGPPQPPADPGLALQPLTPRLAAATGAARGVVVAEVVAGSPASTVLRPGDVIAEIDGQPVDTPDAALLALAARLASGSVPIAFVRRGVPMSAEMRLPEAAAPAGPAIADLETVRGAGTRVNAVRRHELLASAGLLPGDTIVRAGGVESPTASELRRVLAEAAPGSTLILGVRRGDRERLATLEMPAASDGTPR